MLSVGWGEGRNIWLTNFSVANDFIAQAVARLGAERVIVAPSCSLLHMAHNLKAETKLPERVKGWLRFAEKKLSELVALASSDKEATSAIQLPSQTVPARSLSPTFRFEPS